MRLNPAEWDRAWNLSSRLGRLVGEPRDLPVSCCLALWLQVYATMPVLFLTWILVVKPRPLHLQGKHLIYFARSFSPELNSADMQCPLGWSYSTVILKWKIKIFKKKISIYTGKQLYFCFSPFPQHISSYKKCSLRLCVMAHRPWILALMSQRQVNIYDFTTSLVYIASSRPARAA